MNSQYKIISFTAKQIMEAQGRNTERNTPCDI